MKQNAGILRNTATGRWHPILFRASPRPSEYGDPECRHRSVGHHTEGFATEAEAMAFIAEQDEWVPVAVWEWDGTEIPAMSPTLPVSPEAA